MIMLSATSNFQVCKQKTIVVKPHRLTKEASTQTQSSIKTKTASTQTPKRKTPKPKILLNDFKYKIRFNSKKRQIRMYQQKVRRLQKQMSLKNTKMSITDLFSMYVDQNFSWRKLYRLIVFMNKFDNNIFPTRYQIEQKRKEVFLNF